MASTRNVRQPGSIFQNRLENLGSDQGDGMAATRANLQAQAAKGPTATGGELAHEQPNNAAAVNTGPVNAGAAGLLPGELAIIAYNTGQTDGNGSTVDELRFVALSDIAAGTIIYFTDRSWNGSAFTAGGSDGVATYTVGGGGLAAGTTVNLSGAALGTLNPEEAGDAIYAYTGSTADAPTRFLFAIEIGDGNTTFNGSLANTGLTVGTTAVAIGLDSASYQGPTTEAGAYRFNGMSLSRNIADNGNWIGDDADGQKALDQPDHTGPYGTAPDLAIWTNGAGGGGGIFNLSVDATVASGNTGYNLNQLYTNLQNAGVNVFWAIQDVVFDTVHGKFFVADSDINGGHNRVLQGNISDLMGNSGSLPSLTTLYTDTGTTTASRIFNLELDEANGIVYFDHGQTLMKVNYDTASQAGTVLATIGGTGSNNPYGTSNSGFVDDLILSPDGTTIYFTVHRVTIAADGDAISRNYIGKISGITPGAGAGAFSWTGGQITYLNFSPDDDDAGPLGNPNPLESFPKEIGTVEGIALSPDGLTLYILAARTLYDDDGDGGVAGGPGTPPILTLGGIYSYALTGNPTGVYNAVYVPTDDGNDGSQAINLANGPQGILDDIEVDSATGRIYFIDTSGDQISPSSNPPGDEGVWAVNPNGTGLAFIGALSNINGLAPGSLFLNRAPTLAASDVGGTVTEPGGTNSGATNAVALLSGITLSDTDTVDGSDELAGATVRISQNFQAGVTHQDLLTINGTASGTIAGSGITYTYNSATGVMLLSGAATTAEYQAALALVRFATSGDDVTAYGAATSRTIAVSVFDGMLDSDEKLATVTVVGVNDAPLNTVPGAQAATEDTAKIITGFSISDVDADPANQVLTVTLSVTHGTLTLLTNVSGGITAGQVTNNGTGTVTISATQNQINATVAGNGLSYLGNLDFNGSDTLHIVTSDNGNSGTGGTLTDTDDVTINIAAVNDAPVVSGDGTEDSLTILEDTPSAVGQTVNALFAGQYSDARDNQIPNGGASSPGAFSGIAVVDNASSAGTGNWQYFDTGSSTWVNIGARTTATALLISNTTALRFNPAADYNGAEPALTVRLIDNSLGFGINFQQVDISGGGATGGTTAYSAGTVTLGGTITPVNDAPVNAPGGAIVTNEDSSNVPITGISVSDVDDTTLTVTLYVAHGSLTISTAVGGGITAGQITGGANGSNGITITATAAAINATLAAVNGLLYTPDPNFNGSDPLTISTYDGVNTSPTSFATPLNSGALTNATSLVTGDLNGDGKLDLVYIGDLSHQLGVRLGNGDGTFAATTTLAAGANPTEVILADVDGDGDRDIVSTNYASGGSSFGSVGVNLNNGSGVFGAYQSLASLQSPYDVVAADVNGDGRLDIIVDRRDYGLVSVLLATGAPGNFAAPVTYNATTPNYTTGITVGDFNNDGLVDIVAFNQGLKAGGGNGTVTLLLNTGNGTFGAPTDIFTSGTVQPYEGVAYDLNGDGNMDLVFANYTVSDGLTVMLGNGNGTFAAPTSYATGGDADSVSVGDVNGDGRPDLIASNGAGSSVAVFVGNGDGTFQSRVDYPIASTYAETPVVGDFNGDGRLDIAVNGGTSSGQFVLLSTSDRLGDVDVKSITVNSVNDAPSGTDKTVGMNEDGTYIFATSDFGFSDVIDGNSLLAVKVTTLATAGTLYYDADGAGAGLPVAVTLGQFISAADIAAGKLSFVPAADGNGAPYGSFTFQVQDNGGTANSGVDLDQSANTFTFNVAAVNDAPTSTNLNGDAATWIEGGGAITLDVGGNATIADVDTNDFSGGTLTVHIGTGLVAGQDRLGIQSSGAVTVNGANLESGGLVFATFSGGGAGGGDLVITFTSSGTPATAALVQDLVRGITFTNSGGISPTAGLRTISWTLVDGDGGADTLSLTSTVDVQAINDAPTGQDATYVINEDATYSFTAGSFGFNDVNNDAFAGVVITTIPVPGTLFYDADGPGGAAAVAVTAGQFISASEIALGHLYYTPLANGNGVPFSSFTFQVRDNGGTGNGGQDTDQSANTITFDVTAVNDAPVITTPIVSTITNEDSGGFTLSGGSAITVADPDASTLEVTLSVSHGTLTVGGTAGLSFTIGDGTDDVTMTFSGSAAAVNNALNGLHYDPTANYNGPDAISITVTDNGETGTGGVGTDSDSIAITVTSINDAPSGADNTVSDSQDDPYVFTLADFGFSDPNDSPANAFNAISVITFPAQGTLFLDVDGPGGAAPIDLATVGSGVFVSAADIAAGHLYFQPVAGAYGANYASFTFKVQDDGGTTNGGVNLDPTANTLTIDVTPDNLAPVVDLNGAGAGVNNTVSFTEDGAAIAVGTGATVADQDLIPNGGSLVSMTVTLTDKVAGDSLTFSSPLPGGFSATTTMNAGSIQIVITGTGTGAQYTSILNSIVYATTSQDPDVGGTDLQRTVTVVVNDGVVDSAVATTTVNVIAVDDLPVAQPDAFTITESGTIVGASLFANNGAGADSDPDGPPLSISAVNGSAGNVGNQIVLGSGALLTVNANGTFSYDPNGAFLPTPTP
ncbi:FG-GAP-like repeat-containing protein, partial [Allosphingosinicella sp.]|uniref:FG-GAP-like repeat-containing protein n=1 Tax=Allosphingosinicella sp. TaxID=2823234 RepID=UPI00378515D5